MASFFLCGGTDLRGMAEQFVDMANLVLEIQAGTRQCLHLHDWSVWEPDEGTPIQMTAERKGYVCFMLRYRIAAARYPKPQMDLLESIQYVRNNAAKYHVDPDRIGIVGFSAGGHLCAAVF